MTAHNTSYPDMTIGNGLINPWCPNYEHEVWKPFFAERRKQGDKVWWYECGIPDTQRYTRWIEWTTRKVLSEELYDYTAPASVAKQASFLIERENLAIHPAHAMMREQLRKQMDELIRTRLKPVTLEDTDKKPKKKKKA